MLAFALQQIETKYGLSHINVWPVKTLDPDITSRLSSLESLDDLLACMLVFASIFDFTGVTILIARDCACADAKTRLKGYRKVP